MPPSRAASSSGRDSRGSGMKAKASLLVLERWRKRHQQSCHFATHKSLCRVPRTLVHVRESEGTHRFLSFLFEASSGDLVGPPQGPSGAGPSPMASSSPSASKGRSRSVVSNAFTNAAFSGGSSWGDDDDEAFEEVPAGGEITSSSFANERAARASTVLMRAPHIHRVSQSLPPYSQQQQQTTAAPVKGPPPLVLDIPEELRPQDLVALHAIAATHPTLRAVLLRKNSLTHLVFKALLKVLRANANITHIGWEGHCHRGNGSRDPKEGDDDDDFGSPTDDSDAEGNAQHQPAVGPGGDDGSSSGSDDDGGGDHQQHSANPSPKKVKRRRGSTATDPRVLATIQRVRRQIRQEEQFPLGADREARLEAFRAGGGITSTGGNGTPTAAVSRAEQQAHDGGAVAPSREEEASREAKRRRAGWVKQLRAELRSNQQHVAERKKRDWVAREVALYKQSVDVFCQYIQRFVVTERSLRADLIAMEERQRVVLIATVSGNKREALRRDKVLSLLKGIEDRLVWVVGREASFRQLLWDEYHDDCLDFATEMEASRREAITQTELNSRVIIRSIGNASWAVAARKEKARKEDQRLAKVAQEEAEEAARKELWQLFVRELRKLKYAEGEGKDAATVAAVWRQDKERRELAQAKRLEEVARDKEAREAREAAHQAMLLENAQRRDRERTVAHEAQWRAKFSALCDEFFAAMQALASYEDVLFGSMASETRSKGDAVQYLQVLNTTALVALKANAAAEMLGISLNMSMTFAFESTLSGSAMEELTADQQSADLLAATISSLPQDRRWVQLMVQCTANVRLPAAKPRLPPCSFSSPLGATELYAVSSLQLLADSKLLV